MTQLANEAGTVRDASPLSDLRLQVVSRFLDVQSQERAELQRRRPERTISVPPRSRPRPVEHHLGNSPSAFTPEQLTRDVVWAAKRLTDAVKNAIGELDPVSDRDEYVAVASLGDAANSLRERPGVDPVGLDADFLSHVREWEEFADIQAAVAGTIADASSRVIRSAPRSRFGNAARVALKYSIGLPRVLASITTASRTPVVPFEMSFHEWLTNTVNCAREIVWRHPRLAAPAGVVADGFDFARSVFDATGSVGSTMRALRQHRGDGMSTVSALAEVQQALSLHSKRVSTIADSLTTVRDRAEDVLVAQAALQAAPDIWNGEYARFHGQRPDTLEQAVGRLLDDMACPSVVYSGATRHVQSSGIERE